MVCATIPTYNLDVKSMMVMTIQVFCHTSTIRPLLLLFIFVTVVLNNNTKPRVSFYYSWIALKFDHFSVVVYYFLSIFCILAQFLLSFTVYFLENFVKVSGYLAKTIFRFSGWFTRPVDSNVCCCLFFNSCSRVNESIFIERSWYVSSSLVVWPWKWAIYIAGKL